MVSPQGEVVSGNLCLDEFMYVSPLKAQEGTEFHGAQARLAAWSRTQRSETPSFAATSLAV
jgi:hypothetical protein